jgi:hypothetical protein
MTAASGIFLVMASAEAIVRPFEAAALQTGCRYRHEVRGVRIAYT